MPAPANAEALATAKFYAQTALFGIATIAFYRGTWMLFDLFLFPASPLHSACVSVLIGLCFFVLFDNALI
jgi:hypothetical protein